MPWTLTFENKRHSTILSSLVTSEHSVLACQHNWIIITGSITCTWFWQSTGGSESWILKIRASRRARVPTNHPHFHKQDLSFPVPRLPAHSYDDLSLEIMWKPHEPTVYGGGKYANTWVVGTPAMPNFRLYDCNIYIFTRNKAVPGACIVGGSRVLSATGHVLIHG